MKKKKIWEKFKEAVLYNCVTCNLFNIKGSLPETKEQKYWYNRALQDSFAEMKIHEELCESKYNSLLDALRKYHIIVGYDSVTNKHILHFSNDIRDILMRKEEEV